MIERENNSTKQEIVAYNIAVEKNRGIGQASKRGKVREISLRSRARFAAAAQCVREMPEGHSLCVTLTTTLQCPKKAKGRLKGWIDAMRYRHPGFCGVFSLEFQLGSWNAHYHLALRIFEPSQIEDLRAECFQLWEDQNPSFTRKAGDCGRVRDWDDLIAYMEKGETHPECYQKLLPPTLRNGLGTNWWGCINAKRIREHLRSSRKIHVLDCREDDATAA